MYRIMLLDDDHANLSAMQEVLEEEEFGCVEVYADPGEALRRASECAFDVVIAECRLEGQGEMEFIRQFKVLQRQAALIIVTAVRDAEVLFDAVNSSGVMRVIGKPWSCDSLCEAVAQALIRRDYSTRLARMQDLVMDQQRVIERQADILLRLEMAHPGITSTA